MAAVSLVAVSCWRLSPAVRWSSSSTSSAVLVRLPLWPRATDPVAVEWAVSTHVQAHRDVEILREVTGIFLDPSLPPEEQAGPARCSKMIIDATRYNAKDFPAVCQPTPEAMEKVSRDWDRYGISLGPSTGEGR